MKLTNCKIIGLTGGIASGKSTLSLILKEKGYRIIDADLIARQVVEVNEPAYKEIVDIFGPSIIQKDKTIDRSKLGQIVFSNEELIKKLNDITHPYIFQRIKEDMEKYCEENIIFVDIPLLLEELDKINRHNIFFDEIWLVYVDESTQLERLMKRNKYTREEGQKRIKAQMPMNDKVKKATRIIDNTGDIVKLEENIEILLKEL